MNQKAKCHQIEGCKGLYIDAFKAFKDKTSDEKSAFILTHYHSDHYYGLSRGYTGPAMIHCTPVTAELLREIHGIDGKFIVEHNYNSTWMHEIPNQVTDMNNDSSNSSSKSSSSSINTSVANITFYDANHCPGAAIVHVHILHSDKHHIHTGDMRFNKTKFSRYTGIRQAIEQRKIDLLYLDTTYGKPKHDFMPQDDAIKMISSTVKNLLSKNNDLVEQKKKSFFQPKKSGNDMEAKRTLVLLSCYSIGKEKVLWNVATESNQKIYVSKTKHKMLQCIHQKNSADSSAADDFCEIITKCTCNPNESDIHVIKMGLAGTLHPFFKANFEQCALYAHQLNKGYSKVVAFLPTGWANASTFNRENSVASKRIPMEAVKELLPPRTAVKGCYGNDSFIDVEVRIVSYSEHSSFSELRSCVEFFKPKQVVPTVFSNEKDYIEIEKRFHDLVDVQRAKSDFINLMRRGNTQIEKYGNKKKAVSVHETKESCCSSVQLGNKRRRTIHVVENHKEQLSESSRCNPVKVDVDDSLVAILISMGFDISRSRQCLLTNKNDLDGAIEMLLGNQ